MKTRTILILLAILVSCSPASPDDAGSKQNQPIGITINATRTEPQMNVVLQFMPDLPAEPDINWLAQNLVEARKKCLIQNMPDGEETFRLDLTLSNGMAQRQAEQLDVKNPLRSCFNQVLSGRNMLRSDSGKRNLSMDIVFLQSPTAPPTSLD